VGKIARRAVRDTGLADLREAVLAMVDIENESSTPARRVPHGTALAVMDRSLARSADLPMPLRQHQAFRDLSDFITMARRGTSNFTRPRNTDLLPVCNPLSTRAHRMGELALRTERARWVSSDPRITDAAARSLVAAAMLEEPGSARHIYLTAKLSVLPQGSVPLEALVASFGDGNSSAARSARARMQLRDRYGRFAWMGGGMSSLVRRISGMISHLTGRLVAQDQAGGTFDYELADGRIARIPAASGESHKAFLPDPDSPDGYSSTPAKTQAGDPILNEEDLVFVDAPSGFEKDESYTGPGTRYTDGYYSVTKYPPGDKWAPTSPDPSKPTFAASRIEDNGSMGKVLPIGNSWADMQDVIAKDEPVRDKEEGREPDPVALLSDEDYTKLMESGADRPNPVPTAPAKKPAEAPTPKAPEPQKPETDTSAKQASPKDTSEADAQMDYDISPLSVEIDTISYDPYGRTYQESEDYTDDPAVLAKLFSYEELLGALEDGLDPLNGVIDANATGEGMLDFSAGEEAVPVDALYHALKEQGADAPMLLAKIYDGINDNSTNEGRLNELRGTVPNQEPISDEKIAEIPITERKLPPVMEGSTPEELQQYQDTGDYTPWLTSNEILEEPYGYNALDPNPYVPLSQEDIDKFNLPDTFTDNPVDLAELISEEDLVSLLNEALIPNTDMPGYVGIEYVDTDDSTYTVNIPGEAIRDALQLQGVDTNKVIAKIYADGAEGKSHVSEDEASKILADLEAEDAVSDAPVLEPKPTKGGKKKGEESPGGDWYWNKPTGLKGKWIPTQQGMEKWKAINGELPAWEPPAKPTPEDAAPETPAADLPAAPPAPPTPPSDVNAPATPADGFFSKKPNGELDYSMQYTDEYMEHLFSTPVEKMSLSELTDLENIAGQVAPANHFLIAGKEREVKKELLNRADPGATVVQQPSYQGSRFVGEAMTNPPWPKLTEVPGWDKVNDSYKPLTGQDLNGNMFTVYTSQDFPSPGQYGTRVWDGDELHLVGTADNIDSAMAAAEKIWLDLHNGDTTLDKVTGQTGTVSGTGETSLPNPETAPAPAFHFKPGSKFVLHSSNDSGLHTIIYPDGSVRQIQEGSQAWALEVFPEIYEGPEPDATPTPSAPRAPRVKTPHIVSEQAGKLQSGDVTVNDHFTITDVYADAESEAKKPGSVWVEGYYPGHEIQKTKLWDASTEISVYRDVVPPEQGDLPLLSKPKPKEYDSEGKIYKDKVTGEWVPKNAADQEAYLNDLAQYKAALAEATALWDAPEGLPTVTSESTAPDFTPAHHVAAIKVSGGGDLQPYDITFKKESGKDYYEYFIVEGIDKEGSEPGKINVIGHYPGHVTQTKTWNDTTPITAIRGADEVPGPGELPALERPAWKSDGYDEKKAAFDAAKKASAETFTSPLSVEEMDEASKSDKVSSPKYPALWGPKVSELIKAAEGNPAKFKDLLDQEEVSFIDFESTGGTTNPSPLQVAIVKMKGGKVVDRFSVFMNPGKPLDSFYTDKAPEDLIKGPDGTPISDEFLAGQMSQEEAFAQIFAFLGPDAIVAAHNMPFDGGILKKYASQFGMDYNPAGEIDTLALARVVLNGSAGDHKLATIAGHYGVASGGMDWHDATFDAEVLPGILDGLLGQLGSSEVGGRGLELLDSDAVYQKYLADKQLYLDSLNGKKKANAELVMAKAWADGMAGKDVPSLDQLVDAATVPDKPTAEEATTATTPSKKDLADTSGIESVLGGFVTNAWVDDPENTQDLGNIPVEDWKPGDFIDAKLGGYMEILSTEPDPYNEKRLVVTRRLLSNGKVYISSWIKYQAYKVHRRHEELQALTPNPDASAPSSVSPSSTNEEGPEIITEGSAPTPKDVTSPAGNDYTIDVTNTDGTWVISLKDADGNTVELASTPDPAKAQDYVTAYSADITKGTFDPIKAIENNQPPNTPTSAPVTDPDGNEFIVDVKDDGNDKPGWLVSIVDPNGQKAVVSHVSSLNKAEADQENWLESISSGKTDAAKLIADAQTADEPDETPGVGSWNGYELVQDKHGVWHAVNLTGSDVSKLKSGALTMDPQYLPFFAPLSGGTGITTGEGYFFSVNGQRYWGQFGAAGALIRRKNFNGEWEYLLARRASHISAGGGTWAYPGGAHKDYADSITPGATAKAEFSEEMKSDISGLEPVAVHHNDVAPDWAYETSIFEVGPNQLTDLGIGDGENTDFDWFTAEQMKYMQAEGKLHPSFSDTLDGLIAMSEDHSAPGANTSTPDDSKIAVDELTTPINISTWVPSSPEKKKGSNPGGFYIDPATGQEYYVKFPKSEKHARNEVLASAFYEELGIPNGRVYLGEDGDGNMVLVSPILDNVTYDFKDRMNEPKILKSARHGFITDAWLNNWDSVGLEYDNMVLVGDTVYRIDPGGALLFRAQGKDKSATLTPEVTTIDTLTNGQNAQAAHIFGSMKGQDLLDSAQVVADLDPKRIDELVDAAFPNDPETAAFLKERLQARRQDIINGFELTPHVKQAAPAQPINTPKGPLETKPAWSPPNKSKPESSPGGDWVWSSIADDWIYSPQGQEKANSGEITNVPQEFKAGDSLEHEVGGTTFKYTKKSDGTWLNLDGISYSDNSVMQGWQQDPENWTYTPAGGVPQDVQDAIDAEQGLPGVDLFGTDGSVTDEANSLIDSSIDDPDNTSFDSLTPSADPISEVVDSLIESGDGETTMDLDETLAHIEKMKGIHTPDQIVQEILSKPGAVDNGDSTYTILSFKATYGGEQYTFSVMVRKNPDNTFSTLTVQKNDVTGEMVVAKPFTDKHSFTALNNNTIVATSRMQKIIASGGNLMSYVKAESKKKPGKGSSIYDAEDTHISADGVTKVLPTMTVQNVKTGQIGYVIKHYTTITTISHKGVPYTYTDYTYVKYTDEPKAKKVVTTSLNIIDANGATPSPAATATPKPKGKPASPSIPKPTVPTSEPAAPTAPTPHVIKHDLNGATGEYTEVSPGVWKHSAAPGSWTTDQMKTLIENSPEYSWSEDGGDPADPLVAKPSVASVNEFNALGVPKNSAAHMADFGVGDYSDYKSLVKPYLVKDSGNSYNLVPGITVNDGSGSYGIVTQTDGNTKWASVSWVFGPKAGTSSDGQSSLLHSNERYVTPEEAKSLGVDVDTTLRDLTKSKATDLMKQKAAQAAAKAEADKKKAEADKAKAAIQAEVDKASVSGPGVETDHAYDNEPVDWTYSDTADVPSLSTVVDKISGSPQASTAGATALIDADGIEDLQVRVMKVKDKKGVVHTRVIYKLTSWQGAKVIGDILSRPGTKTTSRIDVRRYEAGSDGYLHEVGVHGHSGGNGTDNGGQGMTVQVPIKDVDGTTIGYYDLQRASKSGEPNFTQGHNSSGTNISWHNQVDMYLPEDATPEQIATALKQAGVTSVRPARAKDLEILAENKLLSLFGNQSLGTKNLSGPARQKLLNEIEKEWGVNASDITYSVAPGSNRGDIQILLPEETGKKLAAAAGRKYFTHSFYTSNTSGMSKKEKVQFYADLMGNGPANGMYSSVVRRMEGLPIGGMSPSSDQTTTGAHYIFTHLGNSGYNGSSGGYGGTLFTFDASQMFRRLDWYANPGDGFGKKADKKDSVHIVMNGAGEVMFRTGIPWSALVGFTIEGGSFQDVIDELKARGITMIGNTPIEEFEKKGHL
jgi:DNA polymerase III epsilon subunit-like protein